MDTYSIGTGDHQVQLSVDVSTTGLAASQVIVVEIYSDANGIQVAKSTDATGKIASAEVGTPDFLKNKRLSVFTKIDLTGNDPVARKQESEKVSAEYTLYNGENGAKTFSSFDKKVIGDYESVMLIKHIDLV